MIPKEVKRTENARYFVFNKELTQKVGKEVYTKVFKEEESSAFYCGSCGKRMDDTFLNYCPCCGAKNEVTNKKEEDNKPLEYWEYWCNDGDLLLDTPSSNSNKNNKIENKTTNKQNIPIEWEDTFF